MIKHYLKVALRNLMNFKVHSLISAICLAIGITCFSMMNYFIDAHSRNAFLNHLHRNMQEAAQNSPEQGWECQSQKNWWKK